jgi:hypothetical protein
LRKVRLLSLGKRWSVEHTSLGVGPWIWATLAIMAITLLGLCIEGPRIAEWILQRRLAPLGLRWVSGKNSAGPDSFRFGNVTIESVAESKPIARLDSLEIGLSWWRALWDPREAIDYIHARGVDVDLTLEPMLELYAGGHREGSGSVGPQRTTATPPVLIERMQLRVMDEDGALLSAELPRVVLDGEHWEMELARLELGREFAVFEGTLASGRWHARRPQLEHARVDAATLVWSPPAGEADNSSWPELARRIRRASATLMKRDGPEAPSSTGESSGRWTPDARVELRHARVLEGPGTSGPAIFDRLTLELIAEGRTAIRVHGDGATSTDGSVSWDLHVVPGEAKLEGKVKLRAVPLALFAPVLPALPFHTLDETRVAADLDITGRGADSAAVRGELSISDLAFESEGLAPTPVGPISFTAQGQATWTPARRELSDLRGVLALGATRVQVTGALAWPKDAYRVELRAELPRVQCQSALDSVPLGVLEDLSTIKIVGDIRAKVDVHVDSTDLEATKVKFDFGNRCRFLELPELMNVDRFERPFTHHVLEPDGTMFQMETGPGTAAWTPIEMISPFMIQAVVASEDARFFEHHGFAESEIGRALARNLEAHAFKFGASTITMQLVKNVFLHRKKLLARKAQEALIVWWLEQEVDKKWILELYLNIIEYGSGIYGIRSAAMHYFGIPPNQLTPAQSAFLANTLPQPKSYDKQYAKGTISRSTEMRVGHLLRHMRSRGRIDDEALAYGLEELGHFEFSRSGQPVSQPPQVRGSALAPPFQREPGEEGWSTYSVRPEVEGAGFRRDRGRPPLPKDNIVRGREHTSRAD